MRETKVKAHRFNPNDFLDKLGLNGDHVVSIDEINMDYCEVFALDGEITIKDIIVVKLLEVQSSGETAK